MASISNIRLREPGSKDFLVDFTFSNTPNPALVLTLDSSNAMCDTQGVFMVMLLTSH
jgi:hypothetical protein